MPYCKPCCEFMLMPPRAIRLACPSCRPRCPCDFLVPSCVPATSFDACCCSRVCPGLHLALPSLHCCQTCPKPTNDACTSTQRIFCAAMPRHAPRPTHTYIHTPVSVCLSLSRSQMVGNWTQAAECWRGRLQAGAAAERTAVQHAWRVGHPRALINQNPLHRHGSTLLAVWQGFRQRE